MHQATIETYSDEYLNAVADLYATLNQRHNLIDRGVRFDEFIRNPDQYIHIINLTQHVHDRIQRNALPVKELPLGGLQYGDYIDGRDNNSLMMSLLMERISPPCH
ncbi:MAG TPA: hypothetical protein VIQ81_04040 [Gammaproteobacteria bacterium]